MTLEFEYEAKEELPFDYQTMIQKVIKEAVEQENCPYEIEVNIVITTNQEIQKINQQYREINAPTDVLSFPMIEYKEPANFEGLEACAEEYFNLETGELMLGDIMISLERAKEQAAEYNHSLEREICFLIAHSMLHLFGYDHMEELERIRMEEKQECILKTLGITR